jgi:hypothetical protein
MTLPPSTLRRGVELWISSLRDTRASLSHAPEKNLEQTMRDICGRTSTGLYAVSCLAMSSVRTSRDSLLPDTVMSEQTWNARVTALRKEYSARLNAVRRTVENGYFFSRNMTAKHYFPTPAAAQHRQGENDADGKRGQTLIGAARGQNWPTATAHGNYNRKGASRNAGDGLITALWSTPTSAVATGGQTSRGGKRKGELLLTGQVLRKNWGTPIARDFRTGKGRDGQLPTQLLGLGRQDVGKNNTTGSHPEQLNPLWEETLMGWPPGLSQLTCSAKEWSLWLRRWRLFLFGENCTRAGGGEPGRNAQPAPPLNNKRRIAMAEKWHLVRQRMNNYGPLFRY